MKSKFITGLDFHMSPGSDEIYILDAPLVYQSALLKRKVYVPPGFQTDLASVPRVPIVFWFWGGRAHREGVLHDWLYRIDSAPLVSKKVADAVFFEAMESRGKGRMVRYPMWWGVVLGGGGSYHQRNIDFEF